MHLPAVGHVGRMRLWLLKEMCRTGCLEHRGMLIVGKPVETRLPLPPGSSFTAEETAPSRASVWPPAPALRIGRPLGLLWARVSRALCSGQRSSTWRAGT